MFRASQIDMASDISAVREQPLKASRLSASSVRRVCLYYEVQLQVDRYILEMLHE